jgi:N-acyl-D-amino-acid deacylase
LRLKLILPSLVAVVFAAPALLARQPPVEADLVIVNGRLVDGTGNPWTRADVAIRGDTIVYVGRGPITAKRKIDASGKVVAPGFMDMHAHSEYGLIVDPRALSKITQGVTSEVLGEHLSAGPVLGPAEDDAMMVSDPIKRDWTTIAGFYARLEKQGIGLNVLSYVGSGQVRASVIGYEKRAATPAELDQMKRLVAEAMEQGAFGLSSGLVYVPNAYASTDELIELAKVAASYGGIYVTHLRGGFDGLREGIRIARDARLPMEIHHINSTSARDVAAFVREIEEARQNGVDITANAYPYTAGWTYLRSLLPAWALEGGIQAMLARLKRPKDRARIVAELREEAARQPPLDPGVGQTRWERVFVDGVTIHELAKRRGTSPEDALVDLLIERKGEGFQISFGNTEAFLREALRQPWVDIGSDGSALAAGLRSPFGWPHPRSFGTHPRVLAKYVREGLFSLEEAIRKMTALPASRLGLRDRGLVKPGMKADLVVFDPATIRDLATFDQPEQYAEGIAWVLVNGVTVVEEGKPTGKRPGRVLRSTSR